MLDKFGRFPSEVVWTTPTEIGLQFTESPEQVASLVLYLCRDEAAQITGSNYSIDGGWTAE